MDVNRLIAASSLDRGYRSI